MTPLTAATKAVAIVVATCAGTVAYCLYLPIDQVSYAYIEARKNVWRLSRRLRRGR